MRRPNYLLSVVAILTSVVVFLVPFAFILLTSFKDRTQAAELDFSWPRDFQFAQNLQAVIESRDYLLIIAFINSTILTVSSVAIMVILSAMVAWTLQRRASRWNSLVNGLVLSGLIMPPAVVPTIWVLQKIGLFRA